MIGIIEEGEIYIFEDLFPWFVLYLISRLFCMVL